MSYVREKEMGQNLEIDWPIEGGGYTKGTGLEKIQ